MELRHEFTVPVPVDNAWRALLEIERVARCLPGAAVEKYDEKTVTGPVRVKVGPVTVTQQGHGRLRGAGRGGAPCGRGRPGRARAGHGPLSERDGVTAVTVHTGHGRIVPGPCEPHGQG